MTPALRSAIATTTWGCGLLVLGALTLARAWSSPIPSLLLALAVVAPLLLLRGVLRLGVSRWAAATVLTLLLVLLAYLLSARAETTFTSTVSDAIPLLLSEPQPLVVRPDLLAAPVLACGMTGLLVGLRLSGASRVAPVVGALVLYVAGLLLTGGRADPYGVLGGLLIAVAAAGWALLDDHPEPLRGRTLALAPLVALGVLASAMAAAVPSPDPFDPRDLVESPIETVAASNPMPQLGAWAANPRHELFRVHGPEVPLRLVTLDDYDGSSWSSATRFAAFGTTEEPPLPAGRRQQEITAEVQLLDLVRPWLPTTGQPERISLREALLDTATGTVFVDDRDDDLTFSVTALRDAPRRADLPGATVPNSPAIQRYLRVPELPYSLAEYARAVTRNAASPHDRALAIEAAVRGDRRFSTKAISGSAYWRIERFLLGKRGQPGAQSGSSEQFATAFALLARQNGLPTRIVVGFRPGTEQPDGSRLVRGEDALAWPEVYFDGLGWVPFNPLPDDNTFAHDDVDSTPLETTDPTPDDTTSATPHPQSGADRDAGDEQESSAAGSGHTWWPWLLLGGIVLAPLLVLAGLRALRSWRHRRAGARGAWAEVLDTLTLIGARAAGHESATDVARRTDALLGGARVAGVARTAERAAYAPETSHGTWPDELAAVRRSARRSIPRWRRIWWWFDPRPLRRPRRS